MPKKLDRCVEKVKISLKKSGVKGNAFAWHLLRKQKEKKC